MRCLLFGWWLGWVGNAELKRHVPNHTIETTYHTFIHPPPPLWQFPPPPTVSELSRKLLHSKKVLGASSWLLDAFVPRHASHTRVLTPLVEVMLNKYKTKHIHLPPTNKQQGWRTSRTRRSSRSRKSRTPSGSRRSSGTPTGGLPWTVLRVSLCLRWNVWRHSAFVMQR